ncbi:MAG: CPBP family intramembrane metalloprotease [Ardenticatenaceae bacterium]|nr:CPBP family intramembrane metalloprotease [Anaerolineales bacterium]MCB8941618.1 CPBP family intramembrane metalloprotease [Ardenticatenaceae bacterium]MCB8974487.1 CPBP family intramembrane metalloprotease [Ardenticatenaceae bacterium]
MATYENQTLQDQRALGWPIVVFFVLAYAIAWGAFGILSVIARNSGVESTQTFMAMAESFEFDEVHLSVAPWLVYLLTRLADFAFSIAGVVMIAATAGRGGLRQLWRRLTRWRIGWGWYALGLLPIGLYLLATAVANAFFSANFTVSTITTALFSLYAGFFVSLFLRGALGEELGLRGFALPYLQAHMSPFRASLLIGVLWGAWHLPVLIGRDLLSVVAFSVLSIGLAMLFTLLFNGSGGSLIPVLLFHASQNWEEGFETLFPSLVGTEWELISTLSLLVIGVVAGVMVWRNGRTPPL